MTTVTTHLDENPAVLWISRRSGPRLNRADTPQTDSAMGKKFSLPLCWKLKKSLEFDLLVSTENLMRTRNQVLVLVVVLFGLIYPRIAAAQPPSEHQREMWSAEWITSPDAPQRDQSVLHFRKVIELAQNPRHFLVHVSADNQFLFEVNQERVGSGPSRSDLAHWRFETYDIAPFLRPGKNVLAATVWSFGVLTPLAQISDRTAFLLHGDGEAERLADTHQTWEVEEEKGVRVLPTPDVIREQYYVSEPAERIDGAVFNWDWNTAEPGGRWKNAQPLGHATPLGSVLQENNWQLVPDPLPAMQMTLSSAGHVVRSTGIEANSGFPENALTVPAHSKATVLIDNAHLTTAYPELTVSNGRGATIRLTYAEALIDDKGEKGNRNEIAGKHIQGIFDEFIADGNADRIFMPLGWKTWRYLQLDIETADQPLTLEKLRTWFTAYPFEEHGKFESDDDSLKPIWEIGWRTARLDAHDTYSSCSSCLRGGPRCPSSRITQTCFGRGPASERNNRSRIYGGTFLG